MLFDNLSLDIKKGSITTLIGANGSGKSTFFRLLTKNETPQKGHIFLEGEDISTISLPRLAKRVAIVHQHNSAPADLSVEQLIEYGRYPHRQRGRSARTEEDEQMIAWALGVCDLQTIAHKSIASLSGGQLQRAWIALALAQGTHILLLDEPTSFLDIRYQLELIDLIQRLNREEHLSIVMVLHDINQTIQCSDEVIALANGTIIGQGKPEVTCTPALLQTVYGVHFEMVYFAGSPYVLTHKLKPNNFPPKNEPKELPHHLTRTPATTEQNELNNPNTPVSQIPLDQHSSQHDQLNKTNLHSAHAAYTTENGHLQKSEYSQLKDDDPMNEPEHTQTKGNKRNSRALRGMWACFGLIFFGLGALGAVLPFLPTTPFMLLAAFCFARSSERLNRWFRSTKLYKTILEGYVSKREMTIKAKLAILIPVTILLAIAFYLMANVFVGRIVVVIVWAAHVVYFGFIVKTDKTANTDSNRD